MINGYGNVGVYSRLEGTNMPGWIGLSHLMNPQLLIEHCQDLPAATCDCLIVGSLFRARGGVTLRMPNRFARP